MAPLEQGVRQGKRGLAQKLVGAGAAAGNALHMAVSGGHEDIVNDLVETGVSIFVPDTDDGYAPLHCAAREGTFEILKLLLLKGAYRDLLDRTERAPLHPAARNSHTAAALALLAAGADVNLLHGNHKESVLHVAAEWAH